MNESGRWALIERFSRPGQVIKFPFFTEYCQVETAGLPIQPYKYCTNCVLEMSLRMIALTVSVDLAGGESVAGRGSAMSHKPSVLLRVPFNMHSLFLKT